MTYVSLLKSPVARVVVLTVAFAVIGMHSDVFAAGATVHVEQKADSASHGEWTLTLPGGSDYTSTLLSKVLTGLDAGTYRLTVRPLGSSTVSMRLYRNGVLKEQTSASSLAFDVIDGETIRIAVAYARTGTVEVRSEPAGVSFLMEGNGKTFTGTTPATFADMAVGSYRVTYDLAKDCKAQKQQERSLLEGSSVIFSVVLDCGSTKIPTIGKTSKPLSTGGKTSDTATSDSEVSAAERIVQTASVGEILPGGRVRVTLSVRNVTATTLKNVRITERFNSSAIDIIGDLRSGGAVSGSEILWNIPSITAGSTWTTTFDFRVKDSLKTGEKVLLMAGVRSDASDNKSRPEAASSVLSIGIAYLPQTGGRFDLLFALAALVGAGFATSMVRKSRLS